MSEPTLLELIVGRVCTAGYVTVLSGDGQPRLVGRAEARTLVEQGFPVWELVAVEAGDFDDEPSSPPEAEPK